MSPAQSSLAGVRSVPPVLNKTPARVWPACRVIRAGQDTGKGLFSTPPPPHVTRSPIPTPAGVHVSGGFVHPPLPLEGGHGLAPGQTPRLGAAAGFYKARDSGGLSLPWQTPGSLGTLEPLTPTSSLKPCCAPLPWTCHTHPPPWSPSVADSPLMPARCEAIKGPSWVTPSQMLGGRVEWLQALKVVWPFCPPQGRPSFNSFIHRKSSGAQRRTQPPESDRGAGILAL